MRGKYLPRFLQTRQSRPMGTVRESAVSPRLLQATKVAELLGHSLGILEGNLSLRKHKVDVRNGWYPGETRGWIFGRFSNDPTKPGAIYVLTEDGQVGIGPEPASSGEELVVEQAASITGPGIATLFEGHDGDIPEPQVVHQGLNELLAESGVRLSPLSE